MDVTVVPPVLGHETATTTTTTTRDLYGHRFPDRLEEPVGRLDDAVCPGRAREPTADDEEDDR